MPKSTIQISPWRGSVGTQGVLPFLALLFGGEDGFGAKVERNAADLLDLGEEDVDGLARSEAVAFEDLLGAGLAAAIDAGAEKFGFGDESHRGTNVLNLSTGQGADSAPDGDEPSGRQTST